MSFLDQEEADTLSATWLFAADDATKGNPIVNYTPEPWSAVRTDGGTRIEIVARETGELVAVVEVSAWDRANPTAARAEGNSRMIVAAPAALELLADLIDALRISEVISSGGWTMTATEIRLLHARAIGVMAIAGRKVT